MLKLIDVTIGLRVTGDEEEVGLDLTQHGERGYIMGVGELMVGHSYERDAELAAAAAIQSRDETVPVG